MASFLGHYPGAAINREKKFIRAVDSYVAQDYADKELIIVSDGCKLTNELYIKNYLRNPTIKLYFVERNDVFSGIPRDKGVNESTGDIICYLDSDDIIKPNHLSKISEAYKNNEWVKFAYFDDYEGKNPELPQRRFCSVKAGSIGTSNISHVKEIKSSWFNCNGYHHDWQFIEALHKECANFEKKIDGAGYIVMHTQGGFDN